MARQDRIYDMTYVREQIQILGLAELDRMMSELPKKLNNKLIYGALRRSTRIFVNKARSLISGVSKRHAKAVGTKQVRNSRFPAIWAGHIFKGHPEAFFPHWLEYGVAGVKKKRSPGSTYRPNNPAYLWVAKLAKGQKYREDQRPHPYIRPAWDATGKMVEADFINQLKRNIEATLRRHAKKYGIR